MAQENKSFIDNYIQSRFNEGAIDVSSYDKTFAQAMNDPESIVSYLNEGYNQSINQIVSGISSGTDEGLASASSAYETLNKTITDSTDALGSVLQHPGGRHSRLIASYQEKAARAISREYNQQSITLPDGTQTTIGQYFQNPGQYMRAFDRGGHAEEPFKAYMNGDDPLMTRMLSPFMKPRFENAGGKTPNVNHLQNASGALAVYNNGDLLKQTFDVGADFFTSRLHGDLGDIGGYDKAIPALCTYASEKSKRTNLTGSSLAASVMDDFHTMFTRIADRAKGTGGDRVELSPDSRSLIAATTVKALEAMSNSGQSFDVSDPIKTSAMVSCMSARARAKAAGYGDVFDDADSSSVFADHVAKAGTYEQDQSLIAQWVGSNGTPGLETMLLSLCTGGANFVPEKQSSSTSVAHWGSVRSAVGGQSSAPVLDIMAARLMQDVGYKYFLPQMKQNKSAEEIRQEVSTDIPKIEEITKSLGSIVSRFGVSDPGAQQIIAEMALGSVLRGTPVNLETALRQAIQEEELSGVQTSTGQALRQFYMASVAAPMQFREDRNMAKAWLMSPQGYGLNEVTAETLLARADTETAGMISLGAATGTTISPTKHYYDLVNSGNVYYETTASDSDGNPVKLYKTTWMNDLNKFINSEEFFKIHPEAKEANFATQRAIFLADQAPTRAAYLQQEAIRAAGDKAYETSLRRQVAKEADIEAMIGTGAVRPQ